MTAHEEALQQQKLTIDQQQQLLVLIQEWLDIMESTARSLCTDTEADFNQNPLHQYSLMDELGLTAMLTEEGFDTPCVAIFCDMISLMSHEMGEQVKLMLNCGIAD